MMIFADKKKAAGVQTGGADVKPEMETDQRMSELKACAEDILSAVSSGSASDLARALKAFCASCEDYDQE